MFRFSIRDVLWLTALVAMGAVWYREHLVTKRLTAETARLAAESAAKTAEVRLAKEVIVQFSTAYQKLSSEKIEADRELWKARKTKSAEDRKIMDEQVRQKAAATTTGSEAEQRGRRD